MQSLYTDPAFYFGILAKRTQYKVSVKNTGTQFKTETIISESLTLAYAKTEQRKKG